MPPLCPYRDLNIAKPLTPATARKQIAAACREIVAGSDRVAVQLLEELRNDLGALLPSDEHDGPIPRAYDGVRDAIEPLGFPAHRSAALNALRGVLEQVDRWEEQL